MPPDAPVYTIVFEVTRSQARDLWFVGFGLLFVALSLFLLLYFRQRTGSTARRPSALILLGFSTLWTVVSFTGIVGSARRLTADLREGRCAVVEGVVTRFVPAPPDGKGEESFEVSGVRFHYSQYVLTPGFRQTRAEGGPIHDGARVRIHHSGNDIARLEIAPQ